VFRKDSESRDFAVALCLSIVVVIGLIVYMHNSAPQELPDAHRKADVGSSDVLRLRSTAAAPTTAANVIAKVYECNGAGGRVLSDQPCAGEVRIREVVAPNSMPAVRDAIALQPLEPAEDRVPSKRKSSSVSPARRDDQACLLIDNRIDRINARMRQAYSGSEGEIFRERLRKLEDQRWEAKCHLGRLDASGH
jgi:hypothetical protein